MDRHNSYYALAMNDLKYLKLVQQSVISCYFTRIREAHCFCVWNQCVFFFVSV